ncbi:TIGR04372 family glycosyltransferase [Selenomonas sp. F0473]|uniref:TIGR04372 family glycosyltransferase n=1 Tax=Selenomonas sp. F0473 TaxID=999423 RepID=UPI0025F7D1AE|nr:TIGR04372 family glycosyltransferase [Selenomonas sp. F0473]
MQRGYALKSVCKKIIPSFIWDMYTRKVQKIIQQTQLMNDIFRIPAEGVYGREQPCENRDIVILEKKYDEIIICWLPIWIIGHCCTVYHYAYQKFVESIFDRKKIYVIVPDTTKLAVGQTIPNSYLYNKFTEQMPSVVAPSTAWREYIQKYPHNISVLDRYDTDNFYLSQAKLYFSGALCAPAMRLDEPSIKFSSQEEAEGQRQMDILGIERNFICIFMRDSAYYGSQESQANQIRNSSMEPFRKTAEIFFEQYDMQSVRMGAKVMLPFEPKGCIDYASKGRNEFMDSFLFSRCEFYLGNSSGIDCIARLFAKPIVGIDFPCILPIDEPCMPYHRVIFVKWYDPILERNLTLREVVRLQVSLKLRMPDCHGLDAFFKYIPEHGIIVIPSTSKEILDVAEEMHAVLRGTMIYSAEDEALQEKYKKIIYEETNQYKNITGLWGRVGVKWLRENIWFLD